MMRCKRIVRARLNKIWPKLKKLKQKKNFTYRAIVVAFQKKKNSRLFTIFQDFRSGKLLDKFQDFFLELKILDEPFEQRLRQSRWLSESKKLLFIQV